MNWLIVFFIGLSLSMDAFSICIIIGSSCSSFKKRLLLSIIIGLYHFFMPLIGHLFKTFVLANSAFFDSKLILAIVLLFIGLNIILNPNDNEDEKFKLTIFGMLAIGLGVSLDSLGTGLGLSSIPLNIFTSVTIISLVSIMISYTALMLSTKLKKHLGSTFNFLGGVLLIILSLYYFFKI